MEKQRRSVEQAHENGVVPGFFKTVCRPTGMACRRIGPAVAGLIEADHYQNWLEGEPPSR